jgi:hypothetical protein
VPLAGRREGLEGQDAMDAVQAAITAGKKAQRNWRGRPKKGRRNGLQAGPGMIIRYPGGSAAPPKPAPPVDAAPPVKAARRRAVRARTGIAFRPVSPGLVRIVVGGCTVGHVNRPERGRVWQARLYPRPANLEQPLPDLAQGGQVLRSRREDGHSLRALQSRVRERLAGQGPWWSR